MGSIDLCVPGKPKPRRCLRNHLIAIRTRTLEGDGQYRFIARDEALCRLRRNEGRICRDLWPRVDMASLVFGLWLDLLERLVGPEADDGQSERIDGQFIVLHVLPEDIGDGGCPSFLLQLAMVRGVREDFHELNPR